MQLKIKITVLAVRKILLIGIRIESRLESRREVQILVDCIELISCQSHFFSSAIYFNLMIHYEINDADDRRGYKMTAEACEVFGMFHQHIFRFNSLENCVQIKSVKILSTE